MKTTFTSNWRSLSRALYAFLIAIAALSAMPRNARAQVYVLQNNPSQIGIISEYSTKGELINANFITGLSDPFQIAVSGNALFVTNNLGGTVGKYDTATGGAINAGFITGLVLPYTLAVSGDSLFVASYFHTENGWIIGKYNGITGATINASFIITGPSFPAQIAELGNTLFVSTQIADNGRIVSTVGKYDATTGALINAKFIKGLNLLSARGNILFGLVGDGTVSTYDATTGTAINPSFITGLKKTPISLALLGNRVFVTKYLKDTVADYDATSGALINARFITGTMPYPISIAVKSTK